MCTYNGEKYVSEQLASILSQNRKVDEIIIGDDGSKDHTVALCSSILEQADVEFRIIRNPENLGYRKNFENVIRACSGDIIFLSDQDDVWAENKTECMIDCLEREPEALLAFSDAYLTDRELNPTELSLWESVGYIECRDRYPDWWSLFLKGYFVTGAAVCFRRRLFELSEPFSDIWQHDGWLAVNACIYGEIVPVPQKLISYRQHGDNQIGAIRSKSAADIMKAKWKVLKSGRSGQAELHHLACERSAELLRRRKKDLSGEQIRSLEEAIKVHRLLDTLQNKNMLESLRIIRYCHIHGFYEKYYKKSRGSMLADLMFLTV